MPETKKTDFKPLWLSVWFWILSLALHLASGLYFPQPFGDESYFFYAAKAWAENQSFFAPELHSSRPLYWMPVGYPMLAGLVLKLFSPGFEGMRHLSFVAVSIAFFSLSATFSDQKDGKWKVAILGFFLLSKPWIVCGNLARMESFVLAFLCLAIYFSWKENWRYSWICILLSGAFHPIGLAFLLFWLIYYFQFSRPFFRTDLFLPFFFLSPVLALLYLGFPADLDHLVQDWGFQMAGKSWEEFWLLLFRPQSFGFFALAAFLGIVFRRKGNRPGLLWISLAVFLFCIRIFGRGDTYGIYTSLGICLLAICLWDFLVEKATFFAFFQIRKSLAFSGVLLLLLVSKSIQIPLVGQNAVPSFTDIQSNFSYLKFEEVSAIRQKVDSVCEAKNWRTLAIYPEAVGCILYRKGQTSTHIIHNFEDTKPDGILFFSKKGDSFEKDRSFIYTTYQINPDSNLFVKNENWAFFPNTKNMVVRNRLDALERCRKAGIDCPE